MAQPPGATVKVDILACEKVPTLRVQGSLADATARFNKQSQPARESYSFKTHTKVLECAGSLSYKRELDEKVVAPNGKALKEGDAFKATGNLPTKTVFNSDSVGGFIGLTVTSEALKALMD